VIVLLSVKAGLRAAEIANLTWEMVLDPSGAVGSILELRDHAAKKGHGRIIPLHDDLREALAAVRGESEPSQAVVRSERGSRMKARSIVIWFIQRTVGIATFQPLGHESRLLRSSSIWLGLSTMGGDRWIKCVVDLGLSVSNRFCPYCQ
jgi:integrase